MLATGKISLSGFLTSAQIQMPKVVVFNQDDPSIIIHTHRQIKYGKISSSLLGRYFLTTQNESSCPTLTSNCKGSSEAAGTITIRRSEAASTNGRRLSMSVITRTELASADPGKNSREKFVNYFLPYIH